jgi:hypothetical protein
MEFIEYVQQLIPEAKDTRDGIIIPKQDVIELAKKFKKSDPKAKLQNPLWGPVSKEAAIRYFDDPEEEEAYYLEVTLDDGKYAFRISPDGTCIEYVWM